MIASPDHQLSAPRVTPSMPLVLLRVEGAALLVAACIAFHLAQGSWLSFAVLFLAPDVSMIGYALGPKVGAMAYNLFHTTTLYLLFWGLGSFFLLPVLTQLGLVGLAHIGFDRFIGYGLKYPTQFKATHLSVLLERGLDADHS